MQQQAKQAVANTLLMLALAFVLLSLAYFRLYNLVIGLILILPFVVVAGGKAILIILDGLSNLGTATLSFSRYQTIPKLVAYYFCTSAIIALMIQNSIILSPIFAPLRDPSYEGVAGLGLAFLPRVVSFASSVERARSVLIAILAPLALTSLTLVALRPSDLSISVEPFEVVLLGIFPTITLGDLALYLSASTGFLRPELTIDHFDVLKVRETVLSHLDSYRYSDLVSVLGHAIQKGRTDVESAVLSTIKIALDSADEQQNSQAKLAIATAILEALDSKPLHCKPLIQTIHR